MNSAVRARIDHAKKRTPKGRSLKKFTKSLRVKNKIA